MVLLQKDYTFPRIQRGSNIFQGRGFNFFQGVRMLIFIQTHITGDIPGGIPSPPSASAHVSDK